MNKSLTQWTLAALTASALSLPLGSAFAADSLQVASNDTVNQAQEVVSDTWITSKVKADFLADDSISGLDIKVETNKGVVSLSGVVPSGAERDLAIEKAKMVKGVAAVSADGLKATD